MADNSARAFPSGSGFGIERGMTLRDYFAAQAMKRYSATYCSNMGVCFETLAERAYELADAMLEARTK